MNREEFQNTQRASIEASLEFFCCYCTKNKKKILDNRFRLNEIPSDHNKIHCVAPSETKKTAIHYNSSSTDKFRNVTRNIFLSPKMLFQVSRILEPVVASSSPLLFLIVYSTVSQEFSRSMVIFIKFRSSIHTSLIPITLN